MEGKIDIENEGWRQGKVKGFLLKLSKVGCKLVKAEPIASYPEHTHPNKTEYPFVLE